MYDPDSKSFTVSYNTGVADEAFYTNLDYAGQVHYFVHSMVADGVTIYQKWEITFRNPCTVANIEISQVVGWQP